MIIVFFNITYKIGSTGRIVSDLYENEIKNGNTCYVVCGYSNVKNFNIISYNKTKYKLAMYRDIALSRLTGFNGYRNYFKTLKIVKKLEKIKPDIIHLHNIHGDWINVNILFNYIKRKNIKVIWTLHDCWSFTGRCSYYKISDCKQWQNKCIKCPNMNTYPISYFFDFSKIMHINKKNNFLNVKQLKIITPSHWLYNEVSKSFLHDYYIRIINNGIDLSIFNKEKTCDDIRKKYNINNKLIVLGVSNSWGYRKGLDIFEKLSNLLSDKYVIVLVGTNKKKIKKESSNIITIDKTENINELVAFYNIANVFVNPTREDNFPTVNLEALACGLPIITSNNCGSAEMINKDCGKIVNTENLTDLVSAIEEICEHGRINKNRCLEKAKQYDINIMLRKYSNLYKETYEE